MEFIRSGLAALAEVVRASIGLIFMAPLVALLAFGGEFVQHAWEVSAGMFASKAAFVALQTSPDRLAFGMIKATALIVAVFWSARLLAAHEASASGDLLGPVDWRPLLLSAALTAIPLALVLFAPWSSRELRLAALAGAALIGLPFSRMGMDALFGAARQPLSGLMRGRPRPPMAELVTILPVAGLMVLHFINHDFAFAAPPPVLWLLMVWDSLVVAWLALILGVATRRYYRLKRIDPSMPLPIR